MRQRNNIMDSLNYAEKIQQSILMRDDEVKLHLPDSFIFFQPKDIVSGDFYWFAQRGKRSVIAAIDCTGHGVPGAFLSMIGYMLLNEIVNQRNVTRPADILQELHAGIRETLQQNKDDMQMQDGMDVGLCMIDHEKKNIEYSGAMNFLYVVTNGELKTYKGDLQSVGGHSIDRSEKPFTNFEIPFSDDMAIYLFTDGYIDQFKNMETTDQFPKKTKYGSPRFRKLIQANAHLPMEEQKKILKSTLDEWSGMQMQVDDMLVIGIRIV